MFQVKKEDYNSIQFIPECESVSGKKSKLRKGSGAGKMLILLLILVIAVAAAGIAYFGYFSPAKQFENAFASGDYDTCTALASENAFDQGFVSSITDTITARAGEILADYESKKLSANEAYSALDELDSITDGAFSDTLESYHTQIETSENLSSLLDDADASFAAGKYSDAISTLQEAETAAKTADVDIADDIRTMLTENIYAIKAEIFTDFASQIKNKDYDSITAMLDFLKAYVSDTDFTTFEAVVKNVKEKNISSKSAAATAREIASEARSAQNLAGDTADEETLED